LADKLNFYLESFIVDDLVLEMETLWLFMDTSVKEKKENHH
jgi:hypothetical protein